MQEVSYYSITRVPFVGFFGIVPSVYVQSLIKYEVSVSKVGFYSLRTSYYQQPQFTKYELDVRIATFRFDFRRELQPL